MLVQGVPSTPEATTLAVHRIGAMRRTMYSDEIGRASCRERVYDRV